MPRTTPSTSDPKPADSQTPGSAAPPVGHPDIKVSNTSGHLCHIRSVATYNCSPQTLFQIFTNPGLCPLRFALKLSSLSSARAWSDSVLADNTKLFRDVKEVTSREVKSEDPAGLRKLHVHSYILLCCLPSGLYSGTRMHERQH